MKRLLFIALATAALPFVMLLGSIESVSAQPPATLARTLWEMHRGGVMGDPFKPLPNPPGNLSYHGDTKVYQLANIPPEGDSGWGPAPNGETVGFSELSALPGYCLNAADFTYFQSFVSIPANATVTEFKVVMNGADDGARVSIINSLYPTGLVISGSYIFLGGAQ